MEQEAREQAFITALVTEHFALQSAASATISESSSRGSLYLVTLSSSLVALGFTTGSGDFPLLAAVVLPVVLLLGWFTLVRLVDTSIENVQCLRRISAIRRYYASLLPEGARYFPTAGTAAADSQSMQGMRPSRFRLLFTMASLVAVVNAVVGGAAAAVLLSVATAAPRGVAAAVGAVVAVSLAAGALLYQAARWRAAFPAED